MNYRSITRLSDLADYINHAKAVAFDFETAPLPPYREEERAALDAHKSVIAGISLSVAEGDAVYVPLAHRAGTNADDPGGALAYLKEALFQNSNIIKIAHNLAFESMFLYALGIVVQPPCYDTIAAAQLTLKSRDEFRGLADSGLKLLATSLFQAEMPDFQTVTQGRHFDELDPQSVEALRYACADADYALQLYRRFNEWFDRFMPRHRFLVEEVESPTAVYCGVMKYNGVPVNQDLMLAKQREAETKLWELRGELDALTGGVNLGANASTAAFKHYLYQDLGLPVLKTTEKFKDAADDEALVLLRDWCQEHRPELSELFTLVQEYRKWGKIKSTYIDGYLGHVNAATGRIHPDLMPLATQTGRFAARNPNLQNCPRRGNDPVGVRSFIPASNGNVILSLDFSQIELRVAAFYSRDRKMLQTYAAGGDIHAQTTAVIFGIPLAEAMDREAPNYKERRTIAKNCNFGAIYGLFAAGLQRTLRFKAGLDVTKAECGDIIGNLRVGYPDLFSWQEQQKRGVGNTCYAETWLGRRRYLYGILSTDWGKRSFAERCALNTPIQGTAADILKLACGRVIQGLSSRPWLKPLLQIHDELVFEVPADKVNDAVRFIRACMEARPFPEFDVPIIAEASTGTDFGSLRETEATACA